MDVLLPILAVLAITLWGYHNRYLTRGGFVAAALVGGSVWVGGRWALAVPLVFFFVASSLVTHWSSKCQDRRGPDLQGVPSRNARNARQVLANGVVASSCALVSLATGETRWLFGGLCALAAMTGDTWSSEIGRALVRQPFDLRTRRRVEAGLSGAVSGVGSAVGVLGALATTATGVFILPESALSGLTRFLLISGWAAAAEWVDTLLGAFVQLRFRCARCGLLTDHHIHCAAPAARIGGIPGVDNNMVNLLTTVFAALVALFLP